MAPATERVLAAKSQYEVLRGAFDDLDGTMRNAAVRLPSQGPVTTAIRNHAPVLLVTEDGTVLDVLGAAFPALAVLAIATSPLHPVSAPTFPAPRYDPEEAEMFRRLHRLLRRAVGDADAALLGQVATASARIHQRHQPKPRFADLLNVTASFGACGLAVDPGRGGAALLFDPSKRGCEWAMHGAARAFRELGICRPGGGSRPDRQNWDAASQQRAP